LILSSASFVYGTAAAWRRRWYAHDPARRRRLSRPVISVGNLRTGGSGKTPVVEHIARLLLARGERPAILTRGYARVAASDGVTVVSDGSRVLEPVERAGDEPLMLARALPGVPVLVGADRYLSGRMAEQRFGATIHLLDDGFQHLALARDVDLLIAGQDDVRDRVLPAGHLREPLAAAAVADALLVRDDGVEGTERLKHALGINTAFHIRRVLGTPRLVDTGEPVDARVDEAVFAVTGIARPDRFFADLAAVGWRIAGTRTFRDHHPFTDDDVDRMARAARDASAALVLTTEKDGVRLEGLALRSSNGRHFKGLTIAAVPLTVTIEPPAFAGWLLARVRAKHPQPLAPSPWI
jgi:tetraacyldisaccharide 4'-kinase